MPFCGPYTQKMAVTSFILTTECERLGPSYSVYSKFQTSSFPCATYNFACLLPTTQSYFWSNIGDGHMGTLKKIG